MNQKGEAGGKICVFFFLFAERHISSMLRLFNNEYFIKTRINIWVWVHKRHGGFYKPTNNFVYFMEKHEAEESQINKKILVK